MLLKKWKQFLIIGSLVAGLSACSSSELNENGEAGAEAPATDAPTDAIPQDSVEAPAAGQPSDLTAPSGETTPPLPETAPAPVSAPIAHGATQSYTVKSGDTLMKIAFETYGDLFQWRRIYELNKDKVSDPNRLEKGTILSLEDKEGVTVAKNGEKYLIKQGDTLGTIAGDVYGTPSKWKRLAENNKTLIQNPNQIFAGFYLYYTMTSEDVEYKKSHPGGSKPAPLAKDSADKREPASVKAAAPVPAKPTTVLPAKTVWPTKAAPAVKK